MKREEVANGLRSRERERERQQQVLEGSWIMTLDLSNHEEARRQGREGEK